MSRWHFAGIFLLSAATLLLELALMRVLSVAYWYHFGFLIISTALLAFGVSGVVLTLWSKLREQIPLDRALAVISIAFGLVGIASYWLMQRIPFDPFSLSTDRMQLIFMPLFYIVSGAPFFCSGLGIGLLLSRGRAEVNRLYAADLIGAAAGCGFIVLVTPIFGGAGSVVIAIAVGFLAAAIFGFRNARKIAITGAVLSVLAIPLAFYADAIMPISVIASKRHPVQPEGQTPIYTGWNAFSRVDVYDLPALPEAGRPDPGKSIIIDAGAAGTAIPDLSAGARAYLRRSTEYRPTGIEYVGKQHPNVLIIGSGSGREVLEALDFGARSVTAVEINPIVNDIVASRMRDAWGDLFNQPEVHLVTEDGRSFIRRSHEKYDVIVSMQTMADAAVTSGALTMSETYLFTREAFDDYYDHLTSDGVLLITRPPTQIVKLFATIREMYDSRGLGDPAKNLFAFTGPLAPYGHALFNTGLLYKKSAWTSDELATLRERLGVGHPEQWFGQSPEIFYSPLMSSPESQTWAWFSRELFAVLSAPDLQKLYSSYREDLNPASDDRPFINQLIRWRSLRPADFGRVFFANNLGSGTLVPVAEVMLVTMLAQAVLIAAIFILFPLARFARHGLRAPKPWAFLTFFAGLGLGFIMIEIVFIQRFVLFLGQPIYTFAVVLAGLLAFTGVGSWMTARLAGDHRRLLAWVVPGILAALFLTAITSPWIFSSALGLALPWRIAIVVAMLVPIGVLLGMPFPIGLRIVSDEAPALVPWAWGVNGFFTVIGSISASILAMAFGFTTVLAISGGCYLAALVAMMISHGKALRVGYGERQVPERADEQAGAPVF